MLRSSESGALYRSKNAGQYFFTVFLQSNRMKAPFAGARLSSGAVFMLLE